MSWLLARHEGSELGLLVMRRGLVTIGGGEQD
jgi:hypothetical protein